MKNTLRAAAAAFSIAMAALLLALGVAAAEGPSYSLFPVSAETGEGLGRLVFTLGPGETATYAVVAVNNSDSPLRLAMIGAAATTASGGGIAFPETATPDSWVSLSVPDLSLEPKGRGQFLFTIAVPEDASPGDYLSGIVVQEAGQTDKQVERAVIFSVVQRQALTVHVIVPGPKFASLKVVSIKQVWDGAAVGFDVELHNTGNVRAKTKGTLTVTDKSGKVIGSFPIELGPILAGDTLVHHVSSGAALPPGQYGASVQMSFTPVRLASSQKGATLEPVAVDEAAAATASNFEITPEVVEAIVEQAQERGWDMEGIVIREGPGLWLYVAGGLGVVTFILLLLLGIAARLRLFPLRSPGHG